MTLLDMDQSFHHAFDFTLFFCFVEGCGVGSPSGWGYVMEFIVRLLCHTFYYSEKPQDNVANCQTVVTANIE